MAGMKDHYYGDTPAPYPESPGYKRPGTSKSAAGRAAGRAATLRDGVLAALAEHGPMTADECAARMGESVLSIRPRFSELVAKRMIYDSGTRRKNVGGSLATVWGKQNAVD